MNNITEITLTEARHETISPITGEEVKDSLFGNIVEEPLAVEEHQQTMTEKLNTLPLEATIIVYVTGLTTLFQAVFAAWLNRNCNSTNFSLDMHPGQLVFAHFDRDATTYRFIDALTGETLTF